MSATPSGSLDAVASSVTRSRSLTLWSGPAEAVGASSSAVTVITTVSTEEVVPSDTLTWKVSASFMPSGGVKVGCATVASLSATAVPPVWVQL